MKTIVKVYLKDEHGNKDWFVTPINLPVVFAGRHQIHVIDAGFSCIPIHINSIGYIQMSLYPANIIRKNIEDSIIYFLCYYSYGIMICLLYTSPSPRD